MNVFEWNEVQIYTYFFVLIRATTLFIFLPILGERAIPPIIKVLFGFALSVMAYPMVWGAGYRVNPSTFDSTSVIVFGVMAEAIMGMILGFVARWIFDAVQFAGHFIGTSIGFSMASVLDPHSETQTIALAELQYVLVTLLFLSMDGHHMFLSTVMDSFRVVPLGKVNLLGNIDKIAPYLIQMTAEVIVLGAKLSGPIIAVMVLVNLTFGLLARAVPQMNVLTVSFTTNIFIGLAIVLVSLPGFMNMVTGSFDSFLPEFSRFMRLFGG